MQKLDGKVFEEKLTVRGILEIFSRKPPTDKSIEDPDYFEGGWEKIREHHNLIVNTGWTAIANHLTNTGSYTTTRFTYFAWGDGPTTPALTDTAATFYADCANSDTKAATSIETFDVPTLVQQWNCFLSAGDNAVAAITKFVLVNADPGTVMFNELLFAAIPKDATIEFYFRYRLTFSQV